MTFRHYGDGDPVSLEYISQIPGMTGIVSAVYDVPPGCVWPTESIERIKAQAAAHGLAFEVVESVPVHEDIKLGKPTRDKYIEAYCENIRRLGKAGVRVICYNFMPVFDWLRSDLAHKNTDGSTSLIYRHEQVLAMDPAKGGLSLPGWDESYSAEGLAALLEEYAAVDAEALWDNLGYFIRAIMPACEEAGVNMAIHPDDPPWDIFGLPRIVTNEKNLDRLWEWANALGKRGIYVITRASRYYPPLLNFIFAPRCCANIRLRAASISFTRATSALSAITASTRRRIRRSTARWICTKSSRRCTTRASTATFAPTTAG